MTRSDILVPPPRTVSPTTWLCLHLGNATSIVGWLIFTFGLILVLSFGQLVSLRAVLAFQGDIQRTQAKILEAEETDLEIDGEPVVRWLYQYQVDGADYEGSCFTEGDSFRQGSLVTVEYPLKAPELARLVGTRRAEPPTWVFAVMGTFAVVGLGVVALGFRSGRRAVQLLQGGSVATAVFRSKEFTNRYLDREPVYKVTFEFTPEGSTTSFPCSILTHRPDPLEAEPQQPVLYLPSDPRRSAFLSHLPSSLKVSPDGRLLPIESPRVGCLLSFPTLGALLALLLALHW